MPTSYPTTSFKLKRVTTVGVLGPVFDLDLGDDGAPQLVEGSAELAQALTLRLLMVVGEAWEEPTCGLPWLQLRGMRPGSREYVLWLVLRQLQMEPRVRQVESLDVTVDEQRRSVAVTAYVICRDGSKVKVEL
jgi:hypothetical protein